MKGRFLASGSWLIAAQGLERCLGLVSIAILARVLMPADFGIVAVAGTVVAAVEVLSAFGFDWALLRRRDLSADYLNTAWTLLVILGLFTLTALTLVGPAAASFYRLPQLTFVLIALGLGSLVGSLENIGTVYFRRDFAFHREFLLRAISKVSGFLVTVFAALIYRSYWALVAGMLAVRAASTLSSYALHQYRPQPSLTKARELVGFSSWLVVGNLVDYFGQRFYDLYLGRVFGPAANGLFSVAGELSRMPVSEVAAPINRVAYSKYSEDVRADRGLADSYLKTAALIWMVSLPMCAGIAAVAPEAVALLLGPRWADADTVVRLLALGTVFTVLTANTHYVYWALGHTRIVAIISAVGAAIVVPVTMLCSHFAGYKGVALAYAVTNALLVPVNFAMLRRLAGVKFTDLLIHAWRVSVATIAMLAVLYFGFPQPVHAIAPGGAAMLLAAKVSIGVTVYIGTTTLLWWVAGRPDGPERLALEMWLEWIRARRGIRQGAQNSEAS
jgi:O-antigen/teichoic acid export membrane protein